MILDLRDDDIDGLDMPALLTDSYKLHFNRTDVRGNIKRIFDSIDPKIAKANPLIFHFALDPENKNQANREKNVRNPRVYFMVGRNGMIHILFFDPYHEINP